MILESERMLERYCLNDVINVTHYVVTLGMDDKTRIPYALRPCLMVISQLDILKVYRI
jgi:hypothetical protein